MEPTLTPLPTERERAAKTLTTVIYALYALSLLTGVAGIVAIVINYVKQDAVIGTFMESHFRWQIRTFWYGLLWLLVGMITLVIFIGWLILIASYVWFIYRIAKGWLDLNENQAMYRLN